MAPNEPITFPWGKKNRRGEHPQFLRVCRNCGSLPQKISEVFNKEWLKKPVCFWFWIVWYLTNCIFENHMHISICLVVATIFQIRNCMLMSWDKKHENLRPFNKTFLLYTVILPSIRDSAGVVHPVAFPRNFNDEALALFANDERRHTSRPLRRLVTDHQLKMHPVQPLVGPRDRSCKHSRTKLTCCTCQPKNPNPNRKVKHTKQITTRFPP